MTPRNSRFVNHSGKFLASVCLVFGVLTGFCAEPDRSPAVQDLSTGNTLYTVAYSHLDSQWRWTYPQVIREFLPNTVRQNEPLFEKYPGYVFNFSGAFRYQLIKEYHPEDYKRIQARVAEGRWFPCGNSWEESDTLVPSSESLIRQVLYGHRFFKREFGTESAEFMLPDCFGFPASLPSVLAHCGIRGFSTQKLTWGSAIGIPFNIGVWEGLDGQSVIAALNAGDYNGSVKENLATSTNWVERLKTNAAVSGLGTDYLYHGVGDRGGAPREASVRWVEESSKTSGPVRVMAGRADQMFRDITDAQKAKLPRYRGDLLLTEHSAGSLTSQTYMKKWHRAGELLGDAAERASVVAHVLGAAGYPREKILQAWQLILATEMHDILPGTSLPKAYDYSWNDAVLAQNLFAEVLQHAVGSVARAMNTDVDGTPLIIFNPLSIEREDIVEAEVELDAPSAQVRVIGPSGAVSPAQVLSTNGRKVKFLFPAKVPPVGFAVYEVQPVSDRQPPNRLKVTARSLENARYHLKLNENGDVEQILDKKLGKPLLASPARLAFLHESPREWPAWNMDWNNRTNPPVGYVEGPASFRVVEHGPVRVALEVSRKSRGSEFVQTYRLTDQAGAERIEVLNQILWQSTGCSLKAEFPLTISNPLATYNWEIGKLQRGNNHPYQYEVPTKQWFDLTDPAGTAGVSILTGAKYGSDKPEDHLLRLTLLYSPEVRGKDFREQATQDWGRHEFVYGLASHAGDWRRAGSDWHAARMEQPMFVFQTQRHPGPLGKSFAFLRLHSDQVALRALKLAEDTDEIIVRLQELSGKGSRTKLQFSAPIAAVVEVNGLEKTLSSVQASSANLALDLSPYQLRSLAVRLRDSKILSPAQSVSIPLPFDRDIFSFDTNRKDGAGDDVGTTIPAELMPDTVVSEGIRFSIGPRADGRLNVLSCKGQVIDLPAVAVGPQGAVSANINAVYLLATAVHGDSSGDFVFENTRTRLQFQDWAGYVGQWDRRLFEGYVSPLTYGVNNPLRSISTGYIRRAPVAWFASHRHHPSGRDEHYNYAYFYKYRLAVPPGSRSVRLPDNPRMLIIAMSAASDSEIRPCHPLYDDFSNRQPIQLRAPAPE